MKNFFRSFMTSVMGVVVTAACISGCQTRNEVMENVDPYIGSDGHGHVFVGASVPFGMVQVGPLNIHKGWDWCSGYHYSDSVLIGFAHTHLNGTGCVDMGDILLMPYTGEVRSKTGKQDNLEGSCSSYYSHENETVSPGYYSIKLDNGVFAEMTATERVGFHHFVYPENEEARLLLDPYEGNVARSFNTYLKQVSDHKVVGLRCTDWWGNPLVKKFYFVIETDQPIAQFDLFKDDVKVGGTEMKEFNKEGANIRASLTFAQKDVQVKVSFSSVSIENAEKNLQTEVPHWNFDQVRNETDSKWEDMLSCVEVESDNEEHKRIFYTSLYHMFISPSIYCDVDGRFRGQDDKIYQAEDFTNYSTLSLWDTYRTLHPLLTLLHPQIVPDIINSMMTMCDIQGKLPVWPLWGVETNCMTGYSSVPVIADAYLKGIKGFDAERALQCMVKTANSPLMQGIPDLLSKGFIPNGSLASATSIALEYAADDWGLAMMAKAMGHQDVYEEYIKRGYYYEKYFDKSINFIHPINPDGQFKPNYDPFDSSNGEFCEGNGWHYTFMIPQNPEHLIELMGGDEAFISKLDSLFVVNGDMGEGAPIDITGLIGMYAHGNEPSHHVAYMYNYAGQQWKAAEKISYIQNEFYTDQPDGLIGNEDCGQMSAWHVSSALGFYQVNPSHGVYVFGTPRFPKATLHLPMGKDFTIVAEGVSDQNIYIQSATLNGQPYEKTFITHEDLLAGGELVFVMGPEPNKAYGAAPENRPKSL